MEGVSIFTVRHGLLGILNCATIGKTGTAWRSILVNYCTKEACILVIIFQSRDLPVANW